MKPDSEENDPLWDLLNKGKQPQDFTLPRNFKQRVLNTILLEESALEQHCSDTFSKHPPSTGFSWLAAPIAAAAAFFLAAFLLSNTSEPSTSLANDSSSMFSKEESGLISALSSENIRPEDLNTILHLEELLETGSLPTYTDSPEVLLPF